MPYCKHAPKITSFDPPFAFLPAMHASNQIDVGLPSMRARTPSSVDINAAPRRNFLLFVSSLVHPRCSLPLTSRFPIPAAITHEVSPRATRG